MLTRLSRKGPVIQIGTPEELGEEEKPKYAGLKPGQSIETITFEEALKLFELPKSLGSLNEQEVIVGSGRFGPYVKYGEKYISIPRSEDPLDITLERAFEIIEAKEKEDAPISTFQGHPVTKGKGRFGPFLKWKDLFINVPKKYDFDHLSQSDIQELITAKIEKESNKYIQNWEEEKIAIENGRWGPFIRFKKNMIKIPSVDGKKPAAEDLIHYSLDEVKAIIEKELPGSFTKSTKKSKK
jgi:DNA topoisomerase I